MVEFVSLAYLLEAIFALFATLSHTSPYRFVTPDGEGINSSGKMPRHILIVAHDPIDCGNFEVRVEMDELRQLFADDTKKLLGGHKEHLVLALVRMLRFEYTSKVEREVCEAQASSLFDLICAQIPVYCKIAPKSHRFSQLTS